MTLGFSSLVFGGVILRYRYLLFIFFIILITFSLMGLLFDLTRGAWWGMGIAALTIAFLLKWGEKLVLIFSKARYVTDDELLINQVKNFCCHLNIQEVKVYWSNAFVNNVYYADSFFGKPVLVIGKNIYNQFSRNELNSLIYASLLRIKTGDARTRTFVSLAFVILYTPIYVLRSFFKSSRIKRVFEIFFYPAFSMKAMMYENEKEVLNFDAEVGKMQGLRKDYVAALFKVSHLPGLYGNNVGALVTTELSHVKNSSEDVISNVLSKMVDVKKRMKALSSN